MSLHLRKLVIGSHLFFAREGTVIAAVSPDPGGTVSPSYKPPLSGSANDPNWPELGVVENFTPTPKVDEEDVMAPSPGAYRRVDSIVKSTTLDLAFTLKDVSELFFEGLLLAGGAITADYTPTSGSGQLRGWFKCTQYDQGDVLRNVFDVYVAAKIKATKMDNNLIKAEIDAKVLFSTLNSGTLTLA